MGSTNGAPVLVLRDEDVDIPSKRSGFDEFVIALIAINDGHSEDILSKKSGSDAKRIRKDFDMFIEKYPDGRMNKDDFRDYFVKVSSHEDCDKMVNHVFQMFDCNNDGFVDFDEFMIALTIINDASNEEKLLKFFNVFDTNNEGRITKDELLRLWKYVFSWNNIENPKQEAKVMVSNTH